MKAINSKVKITCLQQFLETQVDKLDLSNLRMEQLDFFHENIPIPKERTLENLTDRLNKMLAIKKQKIVLYKDEIKDNIAKGLITHTEVIETLLGGKKDTSNSTEENALIKAS